MGKKTSRSKKQPKTDYEERVIAFIDILGFKEIILRMKAEPDLYELIRHALDNVLITTGAAYQERLNRPANIEMTSFSDCCVISDRIGDELLVLHIAQSLILSLLEVGILCRGAMVIGDIYHKGSVVFGQGMIDAYEIERNVAKYPRIIVSDSIIQRVKDHEKTRGIKYSEFFKRDVDGNWFLDIFTIRPTGAFLLPQERSDKRRENISQLVWNHLMTDPFIVFRGQLVEHLLREQRLAKPNPDRLSKIRWLVLQFNQAVTGRFGRDVTPIDIDSPTHQENWSVYKGHYSLQPYEQYLLPEHIRNKLKGKGK